MGMFEYFSVFVSIILGLAVVHLLGGISLMLDARVRTKAYWVHLVWTANLLLLTVLVWVANFLLSEIDVFPVWYLLNQVAYVMTIYLMAGLLFPVRGGEVTDFREHFWANRLRFCLLGIAFVATDAIDGVLEATLQEGALNPGQFITLAVYFVIFAVGARTTNERFHGVAAVLFLLGLLGFMESLVRADLVTG